MKKLFTMVAVAALMLVGALAGAPAQADQYLTASAVAVCQQGSPEAVKVTVVNNDWYSRQFSVRMNYTDVSPNDASDDDGISVASGATKTFTRSYGTIQGTVRVRVWRAPTTFYAPDRLILDVLVDCAT